MALLRKYTEQQYAFLLSNADHMTVGELSRLSGVPTPQVWYYLKKNNVPIKYKVHKTDLDLTEQYVLNNYKKETALEMSKATGSSNKTIYAIMKKLELKPFTTRRRVMGRDRIPRYKPGDGMFNVHARTNWLI